MLFFKERDYDICTHNKLFRLSRRFYLSRSDKWQDTSIVVQAMDHLPDT